jgi:DNA-directed RNA polymerase specialized sigma24 family protein
MRATVALDGDQGWEQQGASLHALYLDERTSLLRLASLLLRDATDAEEVVQDAFVRAYLAWDGLRDPDKALAFLRSAVLNRARSKLRHQRVVARFRPFKPTGASAAELTTSNTSNGPNSSRFCRPSRPGNVSAWSSATSYLLELSEEETAQALGISRGSVKTHVHRGIAHLAGHLEVVA